MPPADQTRLDRLWKDSFVCVARMARRIFCKERPWSLDPFEINDRVNWLGALVSAFEEVDFKDEDASGDTCIGDLPDDLLGCDKSSSCGD